MSLLNSPWPRIIKYFPARESLVSDITAGDGKTDNLFNSVLVGRVYKELSPLLKSRGYDI
jgi:hypothetical protein